MKQLIFLVVAFIYGCGSSQQQPVQQIPQPNPTPTPSPTPGGQPTFADIQAIMGRSCISCHANAAFTKTEQALKGSSARSRVQNATMPPPYATQLSAADKQTFL